MSARGVEAILMDLHDAALVMAGIVGSTVAIVHGVLMQRLMVRPIHELTATQLPRTYRLRSWHAAVETEYSIHDRHAVALKLSAWGLRTPAS